VESSANRKHTALATGTRSPYLHVMSDEHPGYFHFTSIWSLQKFGVSSTAFHNQSITMMPGPESSPEFAPPKPRF
jgi:hypothetical protein